MLFEGCHPLIAQISNFFRDYCYNYSCDYCNINISINRNLPIKKNLEGRHPFMLPIIAIFAIIAHAIIIVLKISNYRENCSPRTFFARFFPSPQNMIIVEALRHTDVLPGWRVVDRVIYRCCYVPKYLTLLIVDYIWLHFICYNRNGLELKEALFYTL